MVTIGMDYDVRSGKEARFESVFGGVLALMNNTDGHTRSSLFRDVFRPGRYMIVSEWEDEAAFHAFTSSETFTRIVDWGREDILTSSPHHDIYHGKATPISGGACPVHHVEGP